MTSLTSGELAALVTILATVASYLGLTGVDAGVISQAVTGVIALVSIATSVWAFVQHRQAVKAAGSR